MKKVAMIIFFVIMLLCSCSKSTDSDYLEFPKTKWGMSMDAVLNSYGITKNDTSRYKDGFSFTIKGQEVFGENTSEIIFNFIDLKKGDPVLCDVKVTYPENTNMENVLNKMQIEYGETVSNINIYDLYQVFDDKLSEKTYTEYPFLKLWADRSVIDCIPEKEYENYRDVWEKYQPGLNEDNWEKFSQTASLVTVVWSNNGEFPSLAKNSLTFNAYNLVVYNVTNISKEATTWKI